MLQDLCPAVYIESSGLAATLQPDSLGCFNQEGSVMNDMYPLYTNTRGQFLTPDSLSNPVLDRTRWIVSETILADITEGTIRNLRYQWDDIHCPYDMLEGWEVRDPATGSWLTDDTLSVSCVHPHQ